MSSITQLWDIILESNTFNFLILVVILAVVMQKMKFTDKIEKMKESIILKIEESQKAKEDAENKYHSAKEQILHLDDDIEAKINLAKQQAENVAKSIKKTTDRKLKQIEKNVQKVIEAEEKTIYTTLNDKTAEASVDMAEEYIIEKLAAEPELHDKYIEESIEELERVEL